MNCIDSVENFIKRYKLTATIYRFSDTVESVEKASKLCGADPLKIAKTLVLVADSKPAIAVILGSKKLDYRKFAKAIGVKSVRMATPDEVKMYTGFDIGGVTFLSECVKNYRIVVDHNVVEKEYVWCGGGDKYSLAYVKIEEILRVLNPVIADIVD